MFIKNNMTDAEGFALDTARIGNTSTSKTKIVLPYNGSLPVDLSGTTSAAIVITLQVGLTVNILLTVERDGKKHHYHVKATPGEIDMVMVFLFRCGRPNQTQHRPGSLQSGTLAGKLH